MLNQRATGMIGNKINLTFVPSDGVKIVWTKIGNFELQSHSQYILTNRVDLTQLTLIIKKSPYFLKPLKMREPLHFQVR